MGAWLGFLHQFSCMCIVPLILEQILRGKERFAPELSHWVLGLVLTCLPRPDRPCHTLRAQRSRGWCQQASTTQRPLLKAVVGMCVRRAEEMSEGEWSDNQALAIKTATHSSLSDSTREIFQMCQFLQVSNGREKDAPREAPGARAD